MHDELLNVNIPVREESMIKVLGIGGGGCNAVNYMCRQGIQGVEFVVCNTDIQALRQSPVLTRIQIGKEVTGGHGAGSNPEIGEKSAHETLDYIRSVLEHKTEMLFIAAGMGGGTGTGAAPVIAKLSRDMGILTVAIVTIPFDFEGRRRVEQALKGVDELSKHVDSLLIICDEKLREIYGNLKLSQAFSKADDVLAIAARSIAEIVAKKGTVNVDISNVKTVMSNSGVALMGAGDAEGEDRAKEAVKKALDSPLLYNKDIRGASSILLNILYGDREVTIVEQASIMTHLKGLVGCDVNIDWGSGKDDTLGEKLRVVVIATNFNRRALKSPHPLETPFKVEKIAELELTRENPVQLEEDGRRKEQERQGTRSHKQSGGSQTNVERKPTRNINAVPDRQTYFGRFFSGLEDKGNNLLDQDKNI